MPHWDFDHRKVQKIYRSKKNEKWNEKNDLSLYTSSENLSFEESTLMSKQRERNDKCLVVLIVFKNVEYWLIKSAVASIFACFLSQ